MLRTARLGAKPLATSKSPRESGLWSSIALRLDRDFENGRPRKAKDRFPAINHDAVPVGGYEASLFIHIIQRCDADDEAVGASQQLAEIIRSEEHTSELQSLMRISYAVFCLQKKK